MITPSGPKLVFPKRCLDNTMAIPGYQGKYQLLQIHTHIGSEHRLDGTTSDGEIHLVHKQSNGYYYAVMAILISAVDDDDTAENNTVFESLLNAWEAVEYQTNAACNEGERSRRALTTTEKRKLEGDNHQQQQQQQQQQSLDIYTGLLPQNTNFYQYSGSLTTPPCTEAVFWEVAETSLQISTSQYQRLVALTLSYRDSETCEWSIAASPKTKTTNRPVQDLNGRAVTRICPQQ